MLDVFFLRLRVYKDVIEVADIAYVDQVPEGIINVALERSRGVCKSKRDYSILKVAITGPEGRLLLVTLLDTNLVVGFPDVKLRKDSCSD
jgi:hypothetical protein